MQAEYGVLITLDDHGVAVMMSERDALELIAVIAENISARRGDITSSNGEVSLKVSEGHIVDIRVQRKMEMSIL